MMVSMTLATYDFTSSQLNELPLSAMLLAAAAFAATASATSAAPPAVCAPDATTVTDPAKIDAVCKQFCKGECAFLNLTAGDSELRFLSCAPFCVRSIAAVACCCHSLAERAGVTAAGKPTTVTLYRVTPWNITGPSRALWRSGPPVHGGGAWPAFQNPGPR